MSTISSAGSRRDARVLEACLRHVAVDLVHASGPGGQNVNKVATAVQLRFDIRASAALDPPTKARLIKLGGRRVTAGGVLILHAGRYRTQERNRSDAVGRFSALIAKALEEPKARRPTRATAASKARRLQSKKHRGAIKRSRSVYDLE